MSSIHHIGVRKCRPAENQVIDQNVYPNRLRKKIDRNLPVANQKQISSRQTKFHIKKSDKLLDSDRHRLFNSEGNLERKKIRQIRALNFIIAAKP